MADYGDNMKTTLETLVQVNRALLLVKGLETEEQDRYWKSIFAEVGGGFGPTGRVL